VSDSGAADRPATSLIICIDDFGMDAGINEAAYELGGTGRASAVSCMVDGPAWRDGAGVLRRTLCGKVDIGVHLNLTEPWPCRRQRRLGGLIVSAYAGALSRKGMDNEVRHQLDAFEDAVGVQPDFVDGHQHVHQLPTIRDALLDELSRRYAGRLPWIRNTRPPAPAWQVDRELIKPQIIGLLGSAALRRLAQQRGFRQNAHLLGVYRFDGSAAQYQQRVGRWLSQAHSGDLLMCHPASHGSDALCRARRIEYDFFRSEEFTQLLLQYRVAVVRLNGA
jgi:predicted glycoside hydrolase/deacetylase ChbG (UPF0249 family)